jgi:hypothetical protein
MHTDGLSNSSRAWRMLWRAVRLFCFHTGSKAHARCAFAIGTVPPSRRRRQSTIPSRSLRKRAHTIAQERLKRSGMARTSHENADPQAFAAGAQGKSRGLSHPRECAVASVERVPSGGLEAARAKPIPEFSCPQRAIVGTTATAFLVLAIQQAKPLPTRLFAGQKRKALRFCSIMASVSGVSGAGGRVQVLSGTRGSGAGFRLLLFFAYKAFLSDDTTTDGSSGRRSGRGSSAGSRLLICCVRGGFWRVCLFGTIAGGG